MADTDEIIWTVQGCLDWTTDFFKRRGLEQPRVSAEWLLGAATGFSRVELYTNFDRPLSMEERTVMREGVKRRAAGEPLQYITGETSFRGHSILCAPGVLIPRPETEFLVDLVLHDIDKRIIGPWQPPRTTLPWNDEVAREQADGASADAAAAAVTAARAGAAVEADSPDDGDDRQLDADTAGIEGPSSSAPVPTDEEGPEALPVARVLEVGCGTGCISLALALERPGRVTCVATDISPDAIELAERNRRRCEVDASVVDIRPGDLVTPVRDDEAGTFDVLVSNPPYIPTGVLQEISPEVRDFEPALALDGGTDGLAVYRRLVNVAPRMLKPGGLFACELFEGAVDDAAALCRGAGMVNARVIEDLARKPRFVFAEMPATA